MRFHKLQIAVVLAPLALTAACATDGLYTGGDVGGRLGAENFTQVGRAPVASKPSGDAMASADAMPGLSVEQARRRVEAYLAQAGFEPESVAAAGLYTITGERMAFAGHGDADENAAQSDVVRTDAVCGLKALERPQMYTTHVDIRLGSAGASDAGVQMGIEVKVVELDANLLSGALSKQTCRSRGVLEAALRRAALGG